ncbi:MAG TPA: HopJ type III effector protein [Saprospiraceae bacterium]|nr:HopJ type III effector protein [Saprospiraceae bacterium]
MSIEKFIEVLKSSPNEIEFGETISLIDLHYDFTPTAFKNGEVYNIPGKNSGSCKLLYFAKKMELTKEETLACFGTYYKEVLANPEGDDHQNIRNFMVHSWDGVEFEGVPLKEKRKPLK